MYIVNKDMYVSRLLNLSRQYFHFIRISISSELMIMTFA